MAIRNIREIGSPVLNKVSKEIKEVDKENSYLNRR